MEGDDESAEPTAESLKLAEIKAKMDQTEIELIQNGGANCGWDAADHKDFLRLHTQMGAKVGTVAFFTAMARAVPLADEDQVRLHLEAYNKYLNITK